MIELFKYQKEGIDYNKLKEDQAIKIKYLQVAKKPYGMLFYYIM